MQNWKSLLVPLDNNNITAILKIKVDSIYRKTEEEEEDEELERKKKQTAESLPNSIKQEV